MPPLSDAIAALTRVADALEAEAEGLPPERAVVKLRQVLVLRKAVEELQRPNHSGNVRGMVNAERVRHSKGQGDTDPLVEAANAHHYTLRSLAENLGVSHALLSQARKGTRSIEKSLAEKIEKLTGFPATRGNWPKLKS